MVVLSKNLEEGIDARDMKDGEIAVVVLGTYKNIIVQRYEDILISLGNESGNSYSFILNRSRCEEGKMFVRVLQKGETLTIK
jgi:hypothetical protein